MSKFNNAERETILEYCGEWVLDYVDELERQLESAVEFVVGDPSDLGAIYIRKCFGYRLPKEPMWKVTRSSAVLAKDGEWEHEPIPSSRDDDFYQRCRFDTYDDAKAAATAAYEAISSRMRG